MLTVPGAVSAGIEPTGNCIGAPARFTVETFSAGRGQIEVIILNPKGATEKVWIRQYSPDLL